MTVIDHPTRHLRATATPVAADAAGAAEVDAPTTAPTAAPMDAAGAPGSIAVRAWWDPDLATRGFDTRGAYVERFWLGVLGPSAVFLIRRFARGLEEHPGGFRVDLADTARAIGLGAGTNKQSPIVRTIDRACMFGAMRRTGDDQIEVRTHLPRLTRRQLERLPVAVQRAHDAFLSHPANGPAGPNPGPSAA